MANSEVADRFQNPLRSFPKKIKAAPVLEESRKSKRYNDKEMTEHDKAVGSLWNLFDYYQDRADTFNVDNPAIRRRVAVSIKDERLKRIPKSCFLVPKSFEQIEMYVTRIYANQTLKVDEHGLLSRRIIVK